MMFCAIRLVKRAGRRVRAKKGMDSDRANAADGSSCPAAAQRFGVSVSSAIRWRAMERREGDIKPKRQGGDRHSQRIEAHAELILSAVAAKSDITLAELRERLKERGVAVAIGTLWRFFKRRKITRKKSRRTRPNSAAAR
jgi:transposase